MSRTGIALAAAAIAFGGFSSLGAMARAMSGPSPAEAMRGGYGVVEFVSHWRWETRCFNRKKRVCPRPCVGGPRVCPPRRCWYETVRTCRPIKVLIPH